MTHECEWCHRNHDAERQDAASHGFPVPLGAAFPGNHDLLEAASSIVRANVSAMTEATAMERRRCVGIHRKHCVECHVDPFVCEERNELEGVERQP